MLPRKPLRPSSPPETNEAFPELGDFWGYPHKKDDSLLGFLSGPLAWKTAMKQTVGFRVRVQHLKTKQLLVTRTQFYQVTTRCLHARGLGFRVLGLGFRGPTSLRASITFI